jgi:hypothetical protein
MGDEFRKLGSLAAVASINKACRSVRTGKDGVSKTWSEM